MEQHDAQNDFSIKELLFPGEWQPVSNHQSYKLSKKFYWSIVRRLKEMNEMTKKRSFILFNHQFIKKKTKGYLTEKYLFTYYFLIITLLFFHPSILRLAYSQKVTFLSLLFLLLNERMQKFEWFHISTKIIIMKRWSIILEPIKINCMWSLSFSWMMSKRRWWSNMMSNVFLSQESMNGFCNLILMCVSFNGQCI